MRKAFRHTGVLMMLGVVALGLVGAAYTLWYQDLTVTTTINTGSLAADLSFHSWSAGAGGEGTFAAASSSGSGKPVVAQTVGAPLNGGVASLLGLSGSGTGSYHFTYGNFNPPTNIGVANPAKPTPTCTGTLDNTLHTLTLNLSGLFPYAGCEFQIDISAAADTVPFHLGVKSIDVQQCDDAALTVNCHTVTGNLPWTRGVVGTPGQGDYDKCLALFNADWQGTLPQQVNYGPVGNQVPVQIHPGTDLLCDFMIVLDENWNIGTSQHPVYISDQNLHFKVTTKYVAYQWNESPDLSQVP